MTKTYRTMQGETWDQIAFKVYGSERYATFLMENNYRYLDILVFSEGSILATPDLPEQKAGDLPPWRTEVNFAHDPYDNYDREEWQ